MKIYKQKIIYIIFLLLCGCDGLTLGPRIGTEYVITHPGTPFQILSKTTATGRALSATGGVVEQDISGWVTMPLEHWEVIKNRLNAISKSEKN